MREIASFTTMFSWIPKNYFLLKNYQISFVKNTYFSKSFIRVVTLYLFGRARDPNVGMSPLPMMD